MPSLFVLPRQVPLSSAASLLAGAKLTFSATGTSTPQNTYSDIDLTTPNTNPVVADANGVFQAIYLDPSLPHYRVKLTTSADVLIYQQDDVPSNQNTSQQFRLKAATPELLFEETDASSDNAKWRIRVDGEQLLIDIGNDAESSWENVAALTRSGNTPQSLNFAGQYLRVNDILTATQENSSATGTLTGVTSTQQGSVTIRRTGTKIALKLPALSGTSNSTAMTITGLNGLNTSNGGVLLCRVTDNGTTQIGTVTVGTDSLTFGVGASGGSFTNSGTKGIPTQLLIFDTDVADTA